MKFYSGEILKPVKIDKYQPIGQNQRIAPYLFCDRCDETAVNDAVAKSNKRMKKSKSRNRGPNGQLSNRIDNVKQHFKARDLKLDFYQLIFFVRFV